MSYEKFIYKVRQSVYKWWCVVYKPVYKLIHRGHWPNEKNPYAVYPDNKSEKQKLAEQMAVNIEDSSSQDFSNGIAGLESESTVDTDSKSTSTTEDDALKRANEIIERLAREAAEDESKKQSEIDKAKQIAAENEKLASIMNKNKIDISPFIEEGRNNRKLDIQ